MKFVVITPAKDEESHIGQTIDSVCAQTLRPDHWVIVDDGSTDRTVEIAKRHIGDRPWIDLILHHNHEVARSGGSKVVKAFFLGFETVRHLEFDFLVKLDADLVLPAEYFREVAAAFQSDPRIGICGGFIVLKNNGTYQLENNIDYHVRGAFKAVRKKCFEDIKEFKLIWNWDGIDEIEAFDLGWKTKVLEVPVIQLRPTSNAYSPLRFYFRDGYEAYRRRNNLALFLVRTVFRIMRSPIFLGALAYGIGYAISFFKREKPCVSNDVSRLINRFHFARILSKEKRGYKPDTEALMAIYFPAGAKAPAGGSG